jgi:hypothetical protein
MENSTIGEAPTVMMAPGWFYIGPNHIFVMETIFENPEALVQAKVVFNRLIDDRYRDFDTLTEGTNLGPRELRAIDDVICAAVEATGMNTVGLRLVGLEAIAVWYEHIIDHSLNDDDICLCCRDHKAAEVAAAMHQVDVD